MSIAHSLRQRAVKKIQSTVYSRGDGTDFHISVYATDRGFLAEWSCRKCMLESKCESVMPTSDPAFQAALAAVKAHKCGENT